MKARGGKAQMEARRTNLVEEHGKGMIGGLRAGG